MDFGLAKMNRAIGDDEETAPMVTELGVAMGTVAYMSPEQARGEPLDARTDLFSFGGMLYEMAAGVRPFRGASTALVFEAILNRDPVAVTELRPELPSKLDEIIRRLLVKDRDARMQTAAELLADLKGLKTEPASACSSARRGTAFTKAPSGGHRGGGCGRRWWSGSPSNLGRPIRDTDPFDGRAAVRESFWRFRTGLLRRWAHRRADNRVRPHSGASGILAGHGSEIPGREEVGSGDRPRTQHGCGARRLSGANW